MPQTEFEKAQEELRREFGLETAVTKSGGEADEVLLFEEVEKAASGEPDVDIEDGTEEEVEKSASAETDEDDEEAEPVAKAGGNASLAETIEQIVKSNISAETLQLFDGEAVLADVTKGFTAAVAATDRKVERLRAMHEQERGNTILVMKALVAQNKELRRERETTRAIIGELVKALESTPVQLAPTGLRNLLEEGSPSDAIRKSYMDNEGHINYDELGSVVKSALSKPQHMKTEGEKALQAKHLVVRGGNYRALPKLFREEIGLPTD